MNESNRTPHRFTAQVYYEDTDHSGVVYHANYLKFFERAREDIIGIKVLSDMWHQHQSGFVVYTINIKYRESAVFGDTLDIRTTWKKEGPYRVIFSHEAWRPGGTKAAVSCDLEVVFLGPNKKLMPIPDMDFLSEL